MSQNDLALSHSAVVGAVVVVEMEKAVVEEEEAVQMLSSLPLLVFPTPYRWSELATKTARRRSTWLAPRDTSASSRLS